VSDAVKGGREGVKGGRERGRGDEPSCFPPLSAASVGPKSDGCTESLTKLTKQVSSSAPPPDVCDPPPAGCHYLDCDGQCLKCQERESSPLVPASIYSNYVHIW